MIRINLLGGERQKTKKAAFIDVGQRITLACSLILVLGFAGIGWWYWSLNQASMRVDQEIIATEQERARGSSRYSPRSASSSSSVLSCNSASRSSSSFAV